MEHKKKVLVVDHGSAYINELKNMYIKHPKEAYDVTTILDNEVKGLSKKELNKYDIIHLSGSRRKKNLNDDVSNHVLKNANKNTYVIGTCYGAQTIANQYGVESKRLDEYQQGKKEINYKGGKKHVHKEHRWGIPLSNTSESKLEQIASSNQKFDNGKKGRIYEVFRAKSNPKHIGIQGHVEKGIGKEIMYDILDKVGGNYQKAA